MMSMDDKSILLRRQEDGTWEEKPEPYITIECETEEDFNHIKRCLEATRWIPVEERLPEEGKEVLVWYEYFRYGDYNCMFQKHGIGWQYGGHWSGDVSGTKARCIAWQPLPEPYRPSDEQPEDSQGI